MHPESPTPAPPADPPEPADRRPGHHSPLPADQRTLLRMLTPPDRDTEQPGGPPRLDNPDDLSRIVQIIAGYDRYTAPELTAYAPFWWATTLLRRRTPPLRTDDLHRLLQAPDREAGTLAVQPAFVREVLSHCACDTTVVDALVTANSSAAESPASARRNKIRTWGRANLEPLALWRASHAQPPAGG